MYKFLCVFFALENAVVVGFMLWLGLMVFGQSLGLERGLRDGLLSTLGILLIAPALLLGFLGVTASLNMPKKKRKTLVCGIAGLYEFIYVSKVLDAVREGTPEQGWPWLLAAVMNALVIIEVLRKSN